jgi:hypothetical protein
VPAPQRPHIPPEKAREIVDAGFKVLAAKLHPDAGGSVEEMQKLGEAIAWLRERLPKS